MLGVVGRTSVAEASFVGNEARSTLFSTTLATKARPPTPARRVLMLRPRVDVVWVGDVGVGRGGADVAVRLLMVVVPLGYGFT